MTGSTFSDLALAALAVYAGFFLLGYLIGSIPFGVIFTRLAGTADLRTIGSGNIGATNVLRTGRKDLAAATLIADMLKGTIAVLLAGTLATAWFGPDVAFGLALAAGLGAFLGHIFPVWLGFRGGKGVATFLGILIAIDWRVALIFALVWIAIAALFRFSSLAALFATATAPLALLLFGAPSAAAVIAAMALLLFIKHAPNIGRLIAGSETRIGQRG